MLSFATAQGPRRTFEDRFVAARIAQPEQKAGYLLAVFDGHGGDACAEKAFRAVEGLFKEALQKTRGSIPAALENTVSQLVALTDRDESGSTLAMAYLPDRQAGLPDNEKRVYIAVLGDSLVIVDTGQGKPHLSPIHNVRCNPQELAAAKQRGARYVEGYIEDPHKPGFGVQASRGLGDAMLARVLNRTPDLYDLPLTRDSLVLVGTDGLLDSFKSDMNQQAAYLAQGARRSPDAQAVVDDALRRHTGDNVTAVLWTCGGLSRAAA